MIGKILNTKIKDISNRWLGFIFGVGISFIVLSFRGNDLFYNVIWGIGCLIVLAFMGIVLLRGKEKKV